MSQKRGARVPAYTAQTTRAGYGSALRSHRYSGLILYAPLLAWFGISGLTVYCYAGGPYKYEHTGWIPLYLYLAAVHLAIGCGYVLAVRRYCEGRRGRRVEGRRLVRLVRILAWVGIAGAILGVAANRGSGLSFEGALEDPNAARQTWIDQSGTSLTQYIALLLSVAHYPLIASTFSYWKALPWRMRWQAPIVITLMVWSGVQGGSRHIIFEAIVGASAAALAGAVSGRFAWGTRRTLAGLAIAISGFAVYSSFIATTRAAERIDNYADYLLTQNEVPIDPGHYALSGLPRVVEPAILSGYFYFGHGYEGLAACLEKPFIGIGWGAGHSRFLARNVARVAGDSFLRYTYFDRLIVEDGFSGSLWITIYPWIASDVTFIGSVVVMGLLAWAFAVAWLDTIGGYNIYAPWVLAWIAYTIASTSSILPGGDYGSLLSYWGSLLLWWRHGRRRRGVNEGFGAIAVSRGIGAQP